MARVFVTRRIPGDALERLATEHQVDVWEGRLQPSHAKLVEKARDAEGLLCLLTDRIDRDVIACCQNLRVISNYAVGVDNVDVEAATERGIPVGFTPDVLTEATADATFGLLMACARRVVEGDDVVRAGRWLTWEPTLLLGQGVHGKTLGIVGLGRIGKAVAARAEGFGMEVIHHGKSSGVPLEELLERSDFVSLHVPLSDATRGMIGEAELKRMKPTAILVNTSRGGLIETSALIRALESGWIAGAGLDVTDPEPVPRGHPLLAAPNLIVNPHIASASIEARTAMSDLAVDNLLAGLAGEPMPKCFNAETLAARL
ncbi:MAG TPA: D-glycerate dehydrogenase [Thermoleophilaceae bacterium]|jgi:glyoxylate reductase|nr:D-glycerate dehydrogenase [Thermoleophilaceae bacterium]